MSDKLITESSGNSSRESGRLRPIVRASDCPLLSEEFWDEYIERLTEFQSTETWLSYNDLHREIAVMLAEALPQESLPSYIRTPLLSFLDSRGISLRPSS